MVRRFDIRKDIGRTNEDIRRIIRAFAEGDGLWVKEDDTVYDETVGGCIVRVCRLVLPDKIAQN